MDGNAVIAYVCTIEVLSIHTAEEAVTGNGGQIVLPKTPIPGVGWLFYAKDAEGNISAVTQTDASAA